MTKHQIKLSRARGRTRRLNQQGLNKAGQPLQVRKWRDLDRLGLHGKAREAERAKRIARDRKAAGLTTHGRARRRVCGHWPQLRGLDRREYMRVLKLNLRRKLFASGLTARGTVPVRKQLSPVEAGWRAFRADMNIQLEEAD